MTRHTKEVKQLPSWKPQRFESVLHQTCELLMYMLHKFAHSFAQYSFVHLNWLAVSNRFQAPTMFGIFWSLQDESNVNMWPCLQQYGAMGSIAAVESAAYRDELRDVARQVSLAKKEPQHQVLQSRWKHAHRNSGVARNMNWHQKVRWPTSEHVSNTA